MSWQFRGNFVAQCGSFFTYSSPVAAELADFVADVATTDLVLLAGDRMRTACARPAVSGKAPGAPPHDPR